MKKKLFVLLFATMLGFAFSINFVGCKKSGDAPEEGAPAAEQGAEKTEGK